jgi:hypothetical protein
LQSVLIIQPVAVQVSLALHRNINQLKRGPLPPVVARINQLVNPAVEATLFIQLSLGEPFQDFSQVQLVTLFQDQCCGQPTEGIATMGFTVRRTRYASFVRLAGGDEVTQPPRQLFTILQYIAHICTNQRTIHRPHIHLPIHMDGQCARLRA